MQLLDGSYGVIFVACLLACDHDCSVTCFGSILLLNTYASDAMKDGLYYKRLKAMREGTPYPMGGH